MANEVIITTFKAASAGKSLSSGVYGEKVGGVVSDIGTRTGQLDGIVARLQAKGAGFWYNIGGSGINATANTDGNSFLPDGASIDIELSAVQNYIDTAADA